MGHCLKEFRNGLCALSLVFSAMAMNTAMASGQTGKIQSLTVRASDGLIIVELEGTPRGGRPACATYSYFMVKAEASLVGKQQYAMLLAAKASGKTISINGSNTCTRWLDGEDIDTIALLD